MRRRPVFVQAGHACAVFYPNTRWQWRVILPSPQHLPQAPLLPSRDSFQDGVGSFGLPGNVAVLTRSLLPSLPPGNRGDRRETGWCCPADLCTSSCRVQWRYLVAGSSVGPVGLGKGAGASTTYSTPRRFSSNAGRPRKELQLPLMADGAEPHGQGVWLGCCDFRPGLGFWVTRAEALG